MNARIQLTIPKSTVKHTLLTFQEEHYLLGVTKPFLAFLIHPSSSWRGSNISPIKNCLQMSFSWHQMWYQCHPNHHLLTDNILACFHTTTAQKFIDSYHYGPEPLWPSSHMCCSHASHPFPFLLPSTTQASAVQRDSCLDH